MSAQTSMTTGIHWHSWTLSAESDRRFRLIVLAVGLPILILSIIIPWLNFDTETKGGGAFDGTQYVQLIQEPGEIAPTAEQPKPAEKNEPTPPQKAAPVKQPTKPTEKPSAAVNPHPVESARDVAAKSGLMQFKDQLADLRTGTLNTNQTLSDNTISSKGGIGAAGGGSSSGENIASSAASGSGGIGGTGNAAVTSSQSGSGLGERRTATVKSNIGSGADRSRPGANGDKSASGRSLSEIQLVFDRSKGSLTSIWSRAARENQALLAGGKLVVNFTIAPNGSVSSCELVSSTFGDAELERKMILYIKTLNFGSKDVAPYPVVRYPITINPT